MNSVRQWLESLGLGQYAEAFSENDIDNELLSDLTDEDLDKLGVGSLGHRKKLLKAISSLTSQGSSQPDSGGDSESADSEHAQVGQAERRQLTVMFADLVGSTQLSQELDPEDLRDLNRAYQDAAKTAIETFGGYIARYMGDGVLAYFGYPQAHEDDAERAVRAGLALTDVVPAIDAEPALAVRIGIATGSVVVGDIIGEGASQESAVVGETPSLAARLQGVAEPNTVVLSESTQRLIAGRFELTSLGTQHLKGITGPVPAHQAISPRSGPSRFETTHPGNLTPLIGREGELSLFVQRWERARDNEGQVVLLEGEPGIGKSRLIEALRERVQAEAPTVQHYQCSPYYTATALYPVINHIERAAGFAREDRTDARLDKLEASMQALLPENEQGVALIAALLSLPTERYAPLDMTPQRQRAETITVLVRQLEALSDRGPMLMLFEDMHWSDPSTVELLDAMIDRLQGLPVFALITYRPDFHPPWTGYGHVTAHSLNRLGRQDVRGIVDKVAEGESLPSYAIEEIIAKTDGVPLFVEELTKTVLESGNWSAAGQPHGLQSARLPIPSTLHDALISRLDRLGAAKEVAQMGACIGRVFSYELLTAVSTLQASALDDALSRLVSRGLVFRRGKLPDATYTFKHARVQEVARGSVLRRKRQQLHRQIVQILEARFPMTVEMEPELLAHHCSEAGLSGEAAHYWGMAGALALGRSGYLEALAHLDAGLQALTTLPPNTERSRQALQFQTARAEALLATRGYIANETLEAYNRARELCAELSNPAQVFPVLRGIFNGHIQRGALQTAQRVAGECLELANAQDDPAPLSLAHRMVAQNAFLLGDLQASRKHSEEALALFDPDAHGASAIAYGIDLKSAALLWLAQNLCMLGYPDRALATVLENLSYCRKLGYAFNLALTMNWVCYMRLQRREYRACEEQAEELQAMAQEHGLADFIVVAEAHGALSRYVLAGGEAHLSDATARIAALRATWDTFLLPFNLGILASAQIAAEMPESALTTINDALEITERTGERWSEAELIRLTAEIRLAQGEHDGAESCFLRAVEVARGQNARLWELRTAGLARLWRDRGELQASRDLLAPIHAWFSEGFGTTDLEESGALLEELG